MYKPKLENKTKHQQQTEQSLFSSQSNQYQLNSTDKYKLDHLSDHLHKTIISLRNKKIHLLQKQSMVMTEKLRIEEKIMDLREIKRKRRIDESTKYEKFMLEVYKKRQLMQEKLRQVEAEYKNRNNMKDKHIDFSKACQLKNLEKKTVELKEEISNVQLKRKQQLLNNSLSSKQELISQIQYLQIQKRQLAMKSPQKSRKQLKKYLKQLRCDQLKQLLLENHIKYRVKQIYELLLHCRWKQYKTIQIEQYVLSERRQKKDLFQEISRMNDELKKMQEQNSNLQVFIQNKTINK